MELLMKRMNEYDHIMSHGVSTYIVCLCNKWECQIWTQTREACVNTEKMNTLIIVGLVTYASILRPILDDGSVDTHHMWVWQLFTLTMVVVPSWIPFWSEVALLLCFIIGCIDASVLSRSVHSVVFPEVRRRLYFLRERIDVNTPQPDPATPPPSGVSEEQ